MHALLLSFSCIQIIRVVIEFLSDYNLDEFPSGSSICFREGYFFLVGDDASEICVLDNQYKRVTGYTLFASEQKRIPKPVKADLECATFVTLGTHDYLLAVGSASTQQREKLFLLPFQDGKLDLTHLRAVDYSVFAHRLVKTGLRELNIEGATVVGNQLLLSNRCNQVNRTNHIMITAPDFFDHQEVVAFTVVPVALPFTSELVIGISELCYVPAWDGLLISFSSELTDNAYDDGEIGDSYLGWIGTISQRLGQANLKVDTIVNLSSLHPALKKQKIEGVCVETMDGNELIVHLVADDDRGGSKLFKLKVILN